MKKLILVMVLIMIITLSGCASYENKKANGGGVFVKTNGDYIIINYI